MLITEHKSRGKNLDKAFNQAIDYSTVLTDKFVKDVKLPPGAMPYPKNDIFVCGQCHLPSNISSVRLQIEAQSGKKIIL